MKRKNENKEGDLKVRKNNVSASHFAIGKIYDIGIQACEAKDTIGVRTVLDTLKRLIDSRYKEIPSGFCRLYDYCLQFVDNNKFDKARDILYELHQSWNVTVVTNIRDIKEHNL